MSSNQRKTSKKVSIEGEGQGQGQSLKKLSNASDQKKASIRSDGSENRPGTSNRPGTGSRPSSKKKKKVDGDDSGGEDNDDVWSEYSDDWSDNGSENGNNAAQSAGDILSRVGNAIHGAIFNFGPPYSTSIEDNGLLVYECQEYFASYVQVFQLLLKGANPNWKDEEDLYNSPTHFAAKHCHLHVLRLFKEAHADFNITNEMGQTPLIYAVMMKQRNVKRSKQMALIKYLLRQGADVNFRDKGGYCAIDYAVMNDDLELVERLLKGGANVMRTNDTLVAKRRELITLVGNTPTDERNEIARMINLQYEHEQGEYAKRKKTREVELKAQLEEARHEKVQLYLQEKREMKELIEKQKEQDRILAEKAEDLRRRIREEKEEFRKMLAGNRWRHGEYRKNEKNNLWEWHQDKIRRYEAIGEERFKESRQQMDQYYNRDAVNPYQKRWKRLTGGDIEINWHKADQFITIERKKILDQEKELEILKRSADIDTGIPNTNSIDFRDENDDLLDGEDIMDLLI